MCVIGVGWGGEGGTNDSQTGARPKSIVISLNWDMSSSANKDVNQKWPASVAHLDALSNWRPGGCRLNPRRGRQHFFVEIDHEIFFTIILSLLLIQEG